VLLANILSVFFTLIVIVLNAFSRDTYTMDYLADAMDEDCYSPYDFKLLLEEESPVELVQLCIRAQRRGERPASPNTDTLPVIARARKVATDSSGLYFGLGDPWICKLLVTFFSPETLCTPEEE
jgi:hypothetical protein